MMVACGGGAAKSESKVENGEQQNAEKTDSEYSGMKIVLILPGSIDDQSWNASNNAGAKQCDKETGNQDWKLSLLKQLKKPLIIWKRLNKKRE